MCHGKIEQAPSLATLKNLSPEKIYRTLTTGAMKTQAASLTDQQKIRVAEFLSGRKLGGAEAGDAQSMSNPCRTHAAVSDGSSRPSWNGWSPDAFTNARFQVARAARLSPAATGSLELKWAFGLPGASSAYVQPDRKSVV